MFWKRIKKLWSKKPFVPGDRIQCPHCNSVFVMAKTVTSFKPSQLSFNVICGGIDNGANS
jgi:hypothetical protein